MRIGVWGSLSVGNFGDDAMALIVCEELKKNHYKTVLFRANSALCNECGTVSIDKIDAFVKEVDCVVIAGGGWLKNSKINSMKETDNSHELLSLTKECELQNKKIIAISIGGHGDGRILKPSQYYFLKSNAVKSLSFRLRSDFIAYGCLLLAKREFFPDILLAAGNRLSITKSCESNGPRKEESCVGINLSSVKRYKLLYPAIKLLSLRNKLVSIESFRKQCGERDVYINFASSKIEFHTVRQFYNDLSLLDCVLTSKLHVGVAAISMGIPFFSMRGQRKTKQFLIEADMGNYYLHYPEISMPISPVGMTASGSLLNWRSIKSAECHFEYLNDELRSL